ncbi:MAG: glycosyltransferase family 2 protein [bacterium]|nr:glycosyltransferase family 2 protein [bacterium]
MLDLSIIVISFNTRELTLRCLESVFKYTKGLSFEVVVVDNASDDRSVAEIKRKFRSKVTVIKNTENVGFGTANNQAMKIAQGRYYCLLNSDTLLIGNIFDRMIDWYDQNTYVPIRSKINFERFKMSSIPRGTIKRFPIGVIGCKLLNPDRTEQHSIGKFPTVSVVFTRLFMDRLIKPFMPGNIVEVDYVMGAFMLLKREVFERTNGFDEKMFMYVEEVDWCFRIRKSGFSVVYWDDASIIHYGGQSSKNGRKNRIIQNIEGYLYFYKKYYSSFDLMIIKNMIRVKSLASIFLGRIIKSKYLVETYSDVLRLISKN